MGDGRKEGQMSEYIKRDGVMMVLGQSKTLTDGMRSVLMIPSADVVEVVRCKDCKYSSIADFNDYEDEYRCELLRGHLFFSGDYCSYGARKE